MVVDEPVEAQTVVDSVRAAGGPELRDVQVFDLYRGEQVGEGRKSLALRLEFRSAERTLTDEEVAGDPRADQGAASRTRPGGRCVSSVESAVARSQPLPGSRRARLRGRRVRLRRRAGGRAAVERIRASRWRP